MQTSKNLLPRFAFFMITYYLCYGTLIGYSIVFLQSSGCNNTEIGIYFSMSAIICVLAQGKIGPFLDNSEKRGCWQVILLLNVLSIIFTTILFFMKVKILILIFYTLAGSVNLTGFTCCSNFAMEYINAGHRLNYAVSRGIASLFYASSSLVMGYLLEGFGIRIIFPLYATVQVLALIALAMLPRLFGQGTGLRPNTEVGQASDFSPKKTIGRGPGPRPKTTSETHRDGYIEFFRDKKLLLALFISILFIYMSYTAVNNFMVVIVQHVGGDSHHYGIASALGGYLELPATLLFAPLSKKLGLSKLLGITCFFFLCKITAFCLARNVWQVYLAQSLQFFSYSLFSPTVAYYINSILSDRDKSKGQALLGIFTIGLSGVISSMTSGVLIDRFSVPVLLWFEWTLCLVGLIGVIICLLRFQKQT